METVSREEFSQTMNAVFTKMDKNATVTNQSLLKLTVACTRLEQRFDDMVMPTIPERPCPDLKKHLDEVPCEKLMNHLDHHKSQKDSKKPWIAAVIVTIFLFVQEPIKHLIKAWFAKGP